MLEDAGLATRFDAVVSSEDVLRGLPDPSGYLSASLVGGVPREGVLAGGWCACATHVSLQGAPCRLNGQSCPWTTPASTRRPFVPRSPYPRPCSLSQSIGRPPLRCVVLASSNLSIEAAREAGMKVVALAARRPVYELTAADSVVRHVDGLSFMDLKRLFAREAGTQLVPLAEPEAQPASRWTQPAPFSDADPE